MLTLREKELIDNVSFRCDHIPNVRCSSILEYANGKAISMDCVSRVSWVVKALICSACSGEAEKSCFIASNPLFGKWRAMAVEPTSRREFNVNDSLERAIALSLNLIHRRDTRDDDTICWLCMFDQLPVNDITVGLVASRVTRLSSVIGNAVVESISAGFIERTIESYRCSDELLNVIDLFFNSFGHTKSLGTLSSINPRYGRLALQEHAICSYLLGVPVQSIIDKSIRERLLHSMALGFRDVNSAYRKWIEHVNLGKVCYFRTIVPFPTSVEVDRETICNTPPIELVPYLDGSTVRVARREVGKHPFAHLLSYEGLFALTFADKFGIPASLTIESAIEFFTRPLSQISS